MVEIIKALNLYCSVAPREVVEIPPFHALLIYILNTSGVRCCWAQVHSDESNIHGPYFHDASNFNTKVACFNYKLCKCHEIKDERL